MTSRFPVAPRCAAPTATGHPCHYPAGRCPMHSRQASSPAPVPPALPADPRELARAVVERALRGDANPLHAMRLVQAARALQEFPDPAHDEWALQEVALRGRLMHGLAPATPEQWDLARETFDDAALAEFERWARLPDEP